MKKILVILVIVLIVGGVVFAGYKFMKGEWNLGAMTNSIQPSNVNQNEVQAPIEEEYVDPTKPDIVISEVDLSFSPTTTLPKEGSYTVNGGSYYYKPNIIKVKQGDTVNINFINDGGTHDFKIDEFKVASKQLTKGEKEKITFVADKKGSFEYYCSVGTHRQMGMKGTLIVE